MAKNVKDIQTQPLHAALPDFTTNNNTINSNNISEILKLPSVNISPTRRRQLSYHNTACRTLKNLARG